MVRWKKEKDKSRVLGCSLVLKMKKKRAFAVLIVFHLLARTVVLLIKSCTTICITKRNRTQCVRSCNIKIVHPEKSQRERDVEILYRRQSVEDI